MVVRDGFEESIITDWRRRHTRCFCCLCVLLFDERESVELVRTIEIVFTNYSIVAKIAPRDATLLLLLLLYYYYYYVMFFLLKWVPRPRPSGCHAPASPPFHVGNCLRFLFQSVVIIVASSSSLLWIFCRSANMYAF